MRSDQGRLHDAAMARPSLPLFLSAATLASAVTVAAGALPAHAAFTATTSGTTMSVSVTGQDNLAFECVGGNAVVRSYQTGTTTVASPALACGALTQVNVSGDAGAQVVDGRGLDAAVFGAGPKLFASLGDGNDVVRETRGADNLVLGAGDDLVYLQLRTAPNTQIDMGTNTNGSVRDRVVVSGAPTHDTVELSSTGASLRIAYTEPGWGTQWDVTNAETVEVHAGQGNDAVSAAGVVSPAPGRYYELYGDEGDDTLTGANTLVSVLYGGPGTNTFTVGLATAYVHSESSTDVVNGAGSATNHQVLDEGSPRFGGRTISGFGAGGTASHRAVGTPNDVVVRIRPGPTAGTAVTTHSLDRRGQQRIPVGFRSIDTLGWPFGQAAVANRALGDVVVPAQDISFTRWGVAGDLYDITVPTGAWSESAAAGTRTITTASATAGDVEIPYAAPYKVHGPWTNRNQGFAHRVHRDLLFRFASDTWRDQTRDQVANGSRSRTQVAQGLVSSDEYRGLDVDRVYVRFLGRASDASGRAYWVTSIRNGKSLRQLRAQFFGSPEYFALAGGTNRAFVQRAYVDVIGRRPEPAGLAYWTERADAGLGRGLIARQFLSTSEARLSIVQDQFLRFLDRLPTSAEASTWVGRLASSASAEQDLVVFLAASASYYTRS